MSGFPSDSVVNARKAWQLGFGALRSRNERRAWLDLLACDSGPEPSGRQDARHGWSLFPFSGEILARATKRKMACLSGTELGKSRPTPRGGPGIVPATGVPRIHLLNKSLFAANFR
jgi:hypothetical protein